MAVMLSNSEARWEAEFYVFVLWSSWILINTSLSWWNNKSIKIFHCFQRIEKNLAETIPNLATENFLMAMSKKGADRQVGSGWVGGWASVSEWVSVKIQTEKMLILMVLVWYCVVLLWWEAAWWFCLCYFDYNLLKSLGLSRRNPTFVMSGSR